MSDDVARNETLVEKPADTDQRLWSVTTIIGLSDSKEALIHWAAKETARAAVKSAKSVQAIVEDDGPDAAVDWLKGARFRARQGERTATELGTAVHRACETYALTGSKPEVDDEIQPFLDQFDRWCQTHQPEYEAAEMTVYSPKHRYAGTLDAIMKLRLHDGEFRLLTDYKSSREDLDDRGNPKGPYPNVALQLAAYRYAEFAGAWRTRRYEQYRRRYYLLGEDERVDAIPIPEVDGGLCLYLTPKRCEAYPVRCNETIFRAFLYTIARAEWALELSRDVFGPAITAARREEALAR